VPSRVGKGARKFERVDRPFMRLCPILKRSVMKHGMTATIYKLCERPLWEEAQRRGVFTGAGADLHDGFIHFSTSSQVRETAAKHFATVADLVLIAVDAQALANALRWEPSRGGDLFPHLYGALPLEAVLWTRALPCDAGGRRVFPELLA